jgi:hypothetical protein
MVRETLDLCALRKSDRLGELSLGIYEGKMFGLGLMLPTIEDLIPTSGDRAGCLILSGFLRVISQDARLPCPYVYHYLCWY